MIRQGLREGERSLQCSEMQSRAHEIITGTVTAVDAERGNIVLDLGKGGSAVLPKTNRCPANTLPKARWSRFMWSMFWQPSAAPA